MIINYLTTSGKAFNYAHHTNLFSIGIAKQAASKASPLKRFFDVSVSKIFPTESNVLTGIKHLFLSHALCHVISLVLIAFRAIHVTPGQAEMFIQFV